jgi:hypothetical protein
MSDFIDLLILRGIFTWYSEVVCFIIYENSISINPTTFYNWFKKFKSELMPKCNKDVQIFLPKPKEKKLPLRVVDENIARNVLKVYERLVNENYYDFYDFGCFTYDLLDELDLIPFTTQQKIELMNKSRVAFKQSISNKNKDIKLALSKKRQSGSELN